MRASAVRTAAIADDRAELKGRLSTIVALADSQNRGSLWSYLVEDTLGHQDEFTASRIERRRVSRAIYPLAGALVLAALAFPISKIKRAPQVAPGGQDDLTVDLDDLHLRPAEPGDESGMQVTADAATMRRLQDKLACESAAGGDVAGNSLNQLVNRARDMAGNLQSKLTGRQAASKQRLNLRLADAGSDHDRNEIHRAPETQKNRHGEVAGQFKQDQPRSNREIDLPKRRRFAPAKFAAFSSAAMARRAQNPTPARTTPTRTTARPIAASSKAARTAATAARRTESAPTPTACSARPRTSKLGTEGFEIAIEARPVDHGAKGAGHAYVPPKVRTPLSSNQEPDEPVARAAVPAEDRTTIKRVFER